MLFRRTRSHSTSRKLKLNTKSKMPTERWGGSVEKWFDVTTGKGVKGAALTQECSAFDAQSIQCLLRAQTSSRR